MASTVRKPKYRRKNHFELVFCLNFEKEELTKRASKKGTGKWKNERNGEGGGGGWGWKVVGGGGGGVWCGSGGGGAKVCVGFCAQQTRAARKVARANVRKRARQMRVRACGVVAKVPMSRKVCGKCARVRGKMGVKCARGARACVCVRARVVRQTVCVCGVCVRGSVRGKAQAWGVTRV